MTADMCFKTYIHIYIYIYIYIHTYTHRLLIETSNINVLNIN